jgi:D-glucosaminate-6-phosphate ammonia-lyase
MARVRPDSSPIDDGSARLRQSASIYEALGVRPIINCGSVRTIYGNSLMLDRVRLAMDHAAREFVLLEELAEAIGVRLARLTGAEWGMVTAGSAAGLALAAAACVAGNDPERMLRLPFSDATNVVLAPVGHRFAYDQAIRAIGCSINEFGSVADLEEFLSARPVALISVLGDRDDPSSPVSLERIAAVARRFNVPILVDAASDFPSVPIPWLTRGADLVVFSVGKFMRGPAAAGLLLGRERLVRAAWLNGSPHQAFGRMLKTSKEQMVGALVALEEWLDRDVLADESDWLTRIDRIADWIRPVPGASVELVRHIGRVPKLRITWDATLHPMTSEDLRIRLLNGSPRILIDDIGATSNSVLIDPFNIRDEEAAIVGEGLERALAPFARRPIQVIEPEIDLAGRWAVRIDFANGERRHEFHIVQKRHRLSGEHLRSWGSGELRGAIEGAQASLESTHTYEGNVVRFSFRTERAARDIMEGVVVMGVSAPHTLGPVALGQFGKAKWHGERIG